MDTGVPEVTKIYEPCQQQIPLRRYSLRCARHYLLTLKRDPGKLKRNLWKLKRDLWKLKRDQLTLKRDLLTRASAMLPEVCTNIKRDLHMNLSQNKKDLLILTYLRR